MQGKKKASATYLTDNRPQAASDGDSLPWNDCLWKSNAGITLWPWAWNWLIFLPTKVLRPSWIQDFLRHPIFSPKPSTLS